MMQGAVAASWKIGMGLGRAARLDLSQRVLFLRL